MLEDEQLVRWFLQNGAQLDPSLRSFNPSAAKVFSTTPSGCLEIAASISSVAVLDLLLEHGATKANGFPLHSAAGSAAEDDRIPMMAHLIELGYDVNVTDQGRGDHKIGTPLQYAIMAKSFARVEFLLHEGADPHKAVGRCGSAFKMAERMGMDQIVDLMKRFS